jgi:hypothetical protein
MADELGAAAQRPRVAGLRVATLRDNLDRARERIWAAGRDPADVEICAAVKYLAAEELPVLAEAGLTVVGENRAQELLAKREAGPAGLTWDFIGALQSRKVRDLAPVVRLIHSVASESALGQLERHPVAEVLVEVNVAGEEGKAGIAPHALAGFLERSPVPVTGLMTMPPPAERPEDSRRHFARLAELAAGHGLARLSMGTSQDFDVAAAEGATIVRLGDVLYAR